MKTNNQWTTNDIFWNQLTYWRNTIHIPFRRCLRCYHGKQSIPDKRGKCQYHHSVPGKHDCCWWPFQTNRKLSLIKFQSYRELRVTYSKKIENIKFVYIFHLECRRLDSLKCRCWGSERFPMKQMGKVWWRTRAAWQRPAASLSGSWPVNARQNRKEVAFKGSQRFLSTSCLSALEENM